MPEGKGYSEMPSGPAHKSPGGKAFPPNVERPGAKRFGPPPRAEHPSHRNVYDTDPQGTAKPWRGTG